jgi:hypothetical protein
MRLKKTDKARAELRPGSRTLGQRERTLLLLFDGQRTTSDVGKLFTGELNELASKLLNEGFLAKVEQDSRLPDARPANRQAPPQNGGQPSAKSGSDPFEGKRSLATTRMFLFDICERMFVRRAPEQAKYFLDALRNARDGETMLAAARMMIAEIEIIAGPERADSISERIAMLLPVVGSRSEGDLG